MLPSEQTASEARLEALRGRAIDERRVTELLPELFPAAARHFGGSNYGGDWHGTWRRKGRVASPEVLGTYLARQVRMDRASRAQTELVVQAMPSLDEARRLLDATEDQRLPSLLSRLEDYERAFPPEATTSIPALYALRERLPSRGPGFSDVDPEIRITRVVLRMLRGREPAAVAKVVDHTVPRLARLSDRLSLVRLSGWQRNRAEPLAPDAELERHAQAIAVETWTAPAEQLAREPDLGSLVANLRHFRGEEGVYEALRSRVHHTSFFVRLLVTYMGEVRGSEGRSIQLRWDRLEENLGRDLLIEAVERLPDTAEWRAALTDDEGEIVRQAERYAADPDTAARELEDYRREYS